MPIRVGINGFGRIGRQVLRAAKQQGVADLDFVAVNDLTDTKTLAHLFKYDSVHRTYQGDVSSAEGSITVDGDEIKVFAEKDPANLRWKDLGVDIVLESTGRFTEADKARAHITAGAKKVIISAPAKNEDILDLPHKDLRRARAAAMSIIPTTTGAAKATSLVIPEVKGKIDGIAIRVPTPDVSFTDLAVEVERPTTIAEVNQAFKAASQSGSLEGVLAYSEVELVSSDYIGDPHSCILDAKSTNVVDGTLVKVSGWYDNEWGYSSRCVDLLRFVGARLEAPAAR